jgi:hypothetical protein
MKTNMKCTNCGKVVEADETKMWCDCAEKDFGSVTAPARMKKECPNGFTWVAEDTK